MSKQTLEQERARNAWECASSAQKSLGNDYEKYVNAAKGLPALIMNSGLMQVLAFCHQKGKVNADVATDLRNWLAGRFPSSLKNSEFPSFMQALMKTEPADYQAINAEAFAWLKWLRQMAAARQKES